MTSAISGPAVGDELEIYVARVTRTPDGIVEPVLGEHHDDVLVPGARLLGGLTEGASGEYELGSGQLVVHPNGDVVVLDREECRMDEDLELQRSIARLSAAEVIEALRRAAAAPRPPTTSGPSLAPTVPGTNER